MDEYKWELFKMHARSVLVITLSEKLETARRYKVVNIIDISVFDQIKTDIDSLCSKTTYNQSVSSNLS